MSDGPYRSLPMSRCWKRLAEFSENVNFDTSDLVSAASLALTETWHADVPAQLVDGLRSVFLEDQQGLFNDARIDRVEALSSVVAGHGFAQLVTEHALGVLYEGGSGESGLVEVVERAMVARAARSARQIEEHYVRKAAAPLLSQVRDRVEGAINSTDMKALARQCAGLAPAVKKRRAPKHTGIDEGVAL